jgi:hypothetical protein
MLGREKTLKVMAKMWHCQELFVPPGNIGQQVLANYALQDYILHYQVNQIVRNALLEHIPLRVQHHALPVYLGPTQTCHHRAALYALWGTTRRLAHNAKNVNLGATRILLVPLYAKCALQDRSQGLGRQAVRLAPPPDFSGCQCVRRPLPAAQRIIVT